MRRYFRFDRPSPFHLHMYHHTEISPIHTLVISVITDNSTRTCDTACHTTLPPISISFFFTRVASDIFVGSIVFSTSVDGRDGAVTDPATGETPKTWGVAGVEERCRRGQGYRAKPQKSLSLVKFCWWRAWMGNVIRNGGGGEINYMRPPSQSSFSSTTVRGTWWSRPHLNPLLGRSGHVPVLM